MKKLFLGIGLFCSIALFSCQDDDYTTHYSNGNLVTQEMSIDNFTKIIADTRSNVTITEGSTQKITITASDNIINDINTSIIGDTWLIDFKDNDLIATFNSHELSVVIETPYLSSITMDNGGTLSYSNTNTEEPLNLIHDSSGTMTINSTAPTTTVLHDGSGVLKLSGETNTLNITHDSSGSLNAFDLTANICTVFQDGSGDIQITVTEQLTSTIDSSGDIYYKGDPTISHTSDGSGELIDAN